MNSDMVLFEGTVMDAYESHVGYSPSEVINLSYPLYPINVINVEYNKETDKVEEKIVSINDFGWIQIHLPTFNGVKTGDKIKVIKCK